jgi:NhaA family Na+:H+ antiporter
VRTPSVYVPLALITWVAVHSTALPLAVMIGLVCGKVIGILGASILAVTLKVAERPRDMGWRDLGALSLLGGVGFTVSLLIAELALQREASELAKLAVLIASCVASLGAAVLWLRRSRAHSQRALAARRMIGAQASPSSHRNRHMAR